MKHLIFKAILILMMIFFNQLVMASNLYLVDSIAEESQASTLRSQARELRVIYSELSKRSGVKATLIYSTNTDINAYATEAGDEKLVIVYEGLLAKLENDRDAVAAVLGHELAHHKLQHIKKGQRKKKGVRIFGAILGAVVGAKVGYKNGGLAGSLSNDVVNVGANLVALKFNRNQEMKSDKLSMAWMIEAGYNPKGMLRLQDMLGSMKSKNKKGSILSTHPTSKKRYKAAKKIIAKAKLSNEQLDKPIQPLVALQIQSEKKLSNLKP